MVCMAPRFTKLPHAPAEEPQIFGPDEPGLDASGAEEEAEQEHVTGWIVCTLTR